MVTVVNKAGYKKEFDFAELPVAEPMQRSLAAVFATRSLRWTSHGTAKNNWIKLLQFSRFLSGLDHPPQDLDELTVAAMQKWRDRQVFTNTGRAVLTTVRTLLNEDPRLGSGPVAEELARRVPAPRPSKQSFEEADREKVRLAAQRQFRSVWMRISENTALLEAWRAGGMVEGSREWLIGQALDHLARTGDLARVVHPGGSTSVLNRRVLGRRGIGNLWGRLYPTRLELTSLAVLLTDRFAWNLSVYDRMPTPTAAPSAGERTTVTYQVQVEKRRKGSGRWFSTENITDSGADSPGRLITQALQVTTHGRALAARLAPGTDLLMVARSSHTEPSSRNTDRPRPVDPLVFGVSDDDAKRWAVSHGLKSSPFQRSRRTTVTREGRPLQHAQGTHESVYVLPDGQVQRASRDVFEAGAGEALELAKAVVFGGHIADQADPDHEATATVDCEDEATSPWPAPEGGCGADFLLCLACPNAHVHPGHHPRLAHLHEQLQGLRSALPDAPWNKDWRDSFLRLEDLRNDNKKIGPVAWEAALARFSDNDRAVVQLLLKGALAP
ncbi:hypothetical protein [Streptomyces lavendulocolor]|uniref:hypothetical protein n=1 Tax=Streptomyces lavendulocolor TaxID=67316 RepID=UPI0033EBA7FE